MYEHNPAQRQHITKRPSEYVKQLYVDTCVFGAEHLAFLVSFMGPEYVAFGTDYPFEIADL